MLQLKLLLQSGFWGTEQRGGRGLVQKWEFLHFYPEHEYLGWESRVPPAVSSSHLNPSICEQLRKTAAEARARMSGPGLSLGLLLRAESSPSTSKVIVGNRLNIQIHTTLLC